MRINGWASLLVGSAIVFGAVPARASDPQLLVTTAPAPTWVAGTAMPVHFVIRNNEQQELCDNMIVTLTWYQPRKPSASSVLSAPAPLAAYAGSMHLPALPKGTTRFRITARQSCGFLSQARVYGGASPWFAVSEL